ncbi:MAG TPA: hypothetical protein VL362_01730 [Patescibacteria group bacterium]|jgi:tRNA G10  N-methylase Trm11|nr:hypothetical protein [Patescibacteria group bacterium]
MHIAILGRQPALGIAELERLYGADAVSWFGADAALIDTDRFNFNALGGSQKAGEVVATFHKKSWRDVGDLIMKQYSELWRDVDFKITLGLSAYGWNVSAREVQKTGIILKKKLRDQNVSLRLIPNDLPALSTATSHHNKLGLSRNKVELLIVRANDTIIVAESIGSQNITALAARDQARPKTDAFVGMLPPKLARMMVNMAYGPDPEAIRRNSGDSAPVILDPFCGTGVLLQEAALLAFDIYGSDLSQKMVSYTSANLEWLEQKYNLDLNKRVDEGDAMTHQWLPPIDAVAAEAYLGQPFSAPPSPAKLREVRGNCNHIITSFLENIGRQVTPDTPFCLAVPAWNNGNDRFTHLPLVNELERYGYERIELKNVRAEQLLYFRPGQVVARELLLMRKA